MQEPIQIDFLSGGGELGALIRSKDWSKTSLGPIEDWSPPLVTTLGIVLSSPVAMITLWGEDGVMLYNDAYAAFVGARHPGLLGQPVREGWPEVAGFNDRMMRMVLAGGVLSYRNQEMLLNLSGEPDKVWLNLDYSPVYDGGGVLAVMVDTTGRVLAERQLRQNEAKLRFLDGLGLSIGTMASADEILATITRMLGEHLGVANCAYADVDEDADNVWIRNEWMAPKGPDLSLVGRYRLAQFGPTCSGMLRKGKPFVVADVTELPEAERKGFESVRLAAMITLPLVKEGRLRALMAVHETTPRRWSEDEVALVREVTERAWAHIERARAETERREAERRLRGALEAKVFERTTALQQVRRTEAIGRVTGGVAHDFNNLQTAVVGNLEMLRERVPEEPRTPKLIDNAMAAAHRGAWLTQRMRAFASRQKGEVEPVPIAPMLEGMRELIARTLGPMLSITTTIETGETAVLADRTELEAALLDLLLQARDAMDGLGEITLSAHLVEAAPAELKLGGGRFVCLSIAHAAPGEASAPDEAGLAMARGFAQESGGALRLREATKGETAELWLPAAVPG